MAGLFVEGADPRQYGFNYSDEDLKATLTTIQYQLDSSTIPLWKEIQNRFIQNQPDTCPSDLEWLLDYDFHTS